MKKRAKIFLANIGFRYYFYPLSIPPLGILSLASFIRNRVDAEIKIYDQKLYNTPNDDLIQIIKNFEPDIVGISVMSHTAKHLNYIVDKLKREIPSCLVVVGGPHVSSLEEAVLKNNKADVAIVGEGELAFAKLIKAHLRASSFDDISGLIWRTSNNEIVKNKGVSDLIEDIDSIPFPYRNYSIYYYNKSATSKKNYQLQLLNSREPGVMNQNRYRIRKTTPLFF